MLSSPSFLGHFWLILLIMGFIFLPICMTNNFLFDVRHCKFCHIGYRIFLNYCTGPFWPVTLWVMKFSILAGGKRWYLWPHVSTGTLSILGVVLSLSSGGFSHLHPGHIFGVLAFCIPSSLVLFPVNSACLVLSSIPAFSLQLRETNELHLNLLCLSCYLENSPGNKLGQW